MPIAITRKLFLSNAQNQCNLIIYNQFGTQNRNKKQPMMHSPKKQTLFVEDADIDQTNSLQQESFKLGTKKREPSPTTDNIVQKQNENPADLVKKWPTKCSNWVFSIIISLLIVFFMAQAASQFASISEKKDRFAHNLQELKQSKFANQYLPQYVPVGKATKFHPTNNADPNPSQKINLKTNQANVIKYFSQDNQTSSQKEKLLKQLRNSGPSTYITPQNSFVPNVPKGETVLPAEIPSQNPILIQTPLQTNQRSVPEVTVVPSIITNLEFQSFGQPAAPLQIKSEWEISPTIQPFNSVALIANDLSFEGSFASIYNSQLMLAGRLRELIYSDIYTLDKLALEERDYYEEKYSISKYEELPFCIVVPTYNNAAKERYINNMKSIVMQEYKNFHIVILDDASDDNTGVLIKEFLQNQNKVQAERYQIIRNTVQLRAMPNLRNAAKNYCKPEQIFLIVDGDDELLGKHVLKLFNAVFQEKKLWFVYSNFLSTSGGVGFSRPFPARTIESNTYRAYPFVTSHLRAFYTKLFVNIKEEDLKDEAGEYLRAANDVAICIPVLEQAHERVGYLPELTYYYNSNTGLNNHQLRLSEQRNNDRKIRKRTPYKPLQNFLD